MIDSIARKLASKAYKLANNSATLKNNLTATSAPSVTDDEDAGYDVGSAWVYDNTTYTCVDSTVGKAVWQSSSDIITFNTWAEVIAAISILSPSYIGKYALVANANSAPSAGITYTYGEALTDYIVDGGSATLKINDQGDNYSVTTMPRTITNPIVTSVMLTASTKPTLKGYYIFTILPSDGLPSGCNLNDILYYNGITWSVWQSYSQANTVLVATNATGATQVTWRKFAGTWMSTADEYIPDGKEYQTSKLWNGKPVFRKCKSGTTTSSVDSNSHSVGISVPITGTVIIIMGTITRTSGTRQTVVGGTGAVFAVDSSGNVIYNSASDPAWASIPYTVWCEYTKS